ADRKRKVRKSIRGNCPHIAWGTRQSLVFRWVLYFCKMPNIFDALKQKCLTFLTVFLLENKKDTREISRIFYAAIAPVCCNQKILSAKNIASLPTPQMRAEPRLCCQGNPI